MLALLQAHALCSTVSSYYGPMRTWKAIVHEEHSRENAKQEKAKVRTTLTCDALEVLGAVCKGTRVGSLVLSACTDQRKSAGGGVATLACFTALLCECAADLLRCQAAEPFEIGLSFQVALQLTLDRIKAEMESESGSESLLTKCSNERDEDRLAHGKAAQEMMPIARQVATLLSQSRTDDSNDLDLGAVMVHRVFGGKAAAKPEILHGLLFPLHAHVDTNLGYTDATLEENDKNEAAALERMLQIALQTRERKGRGPICVVGLVSNSLSPEALRAGAPRATPGLAAPLTVVRGMKQQGGLSLAQSLVARSRVKSTEVADLAARFQHLDLVVCSGHAHPGLVAACAERLGVIILPRRNIRELEALSRSFGVPILADLSQLVESTGPVASRERSSAQASLKEIGAYRSSCDTIGAQFFVLEWCNRAIKTPRSFISPLAQPVTLLLSAPVQALLAEQEMAFWSCLYKLRNLRRTNFVAARGGGFTERLLAEYIRRYPQEDLNFRRQRRHILCGIERFASALDSLARISTDQYECKTTNHLRQSPPLDCLASKMGWLRAATALVYRLLMLA